MAAKTAGKPAAKKPAATKPKAKKAAPAKAKEPAVVESFDLVAGDAHAVLTVNGDKTRWSPEQVDALRRSVTVAFVELH